METAEPEISPPPLPPAPACRRRWGLAFAIVGLIAFYAYLFYDSGGTAPEDKLSWREDPVGLTLRYADREMAYAEVVETLPQPLRFWLAWEDWPGAGPEENTARALEECHAYLLERDNPDEYPAVALTLAVLAAEQGDAATMERWLAQLEKSSEQVEAAARVRDAYAKPPRRVPEEVGIETAEKLGGPWFQNTLKARFAASRGDTDAAADLRAAAAGEIESRVAAITAITIFSIAILLGGLVGVAYWWKRRVPCDALQPGWSPVAAINIVAWGGLLGMLLIWGLWTFIDRVPGFEWLSYSMMPWMFLPTLLVFHLAVCRPQGIRMVDAFGLRPTWPLLFAGLAVYFIDWAVQTGWFALLEAGGTLPSPVEGLGEVMIWGGTAARTTDTLDAALGAGIFEEIVYRGILFLGLRRKFNFTTAALVSSLMFTLPHLQYGIAGLSSVAIYGFIAAWSVERTRSILPAIIAHALYNFTVSIWQWSIYT
jgi:membrane protease YdiL (CAAX protease family)